MKKILITLLLLQSCNSASKELRSEYNLSKQHLDAEFQKILPDFDELFKTQRNGAAIFTLCKTDTLFTNNDFSKYESHEIDLCNQDVWIATSSLTETELTIHIGEIFGNQFITYTVKSGSILTEFRESYKYDNFVKLHEIDMPVKELIVPLEVQEIKLSKSKNFQKGETIYGKAKIVTKEYWVQPMGYDFEKIRRNWGYIFKCKVR